MPYQPPLVLEIGGVSYKYFSNYNFGGVRAQRPSQFNCTLKLYGEDHPYPGALALVKQLEGGSYQNFFDGTLQVATIEKFRPVTFKLSFTDFSYQFSTACLSYATGSTALSVSAIATAILLNNGLATAVSGLAPFDVQVIGSPGNLTFSVKPGGTVLDAINSLAKAAGCYWAVRGNFTSTTLPLPGPTRATLYFIQRGYNLSTAPIETINADGACLDQTVQTNRWRDLTITRKLQPVTAIVVATNERAAIAEGAPIPPIEIFSDWEEEDSEKDFFENFLPDPEDLRAITTLEVQPQSGAATQLDVITYDPANPPAAGEAAIDGRNVRLGIAIGQTDPGYAGWQTRLHLVGVARNAYGIAIDTAKEAEQAALAGLTPEQIRNKQIIYMPGISSNSVANMAAQTLLAGLPNPVSFGFNTKERTPQYWRFGEDAVNLLYTAWNILNEKLPVAGVNINSIEDSRGARGQKAIEVLTRVDCASDPEPDLETVATTGLALANIPVTAPVIESEPGGGGGEPETLCDYDLIEAFAGTGTAGLTDGEALGTAEFNAPFSGFYTGTELLVADALNFALRKVQGGNVTTLIGTGTRASDKPVFGTAAAGQEAQEIYGVCKKDNDIYFTDGNWQYVGKIDSDGIITEFADLNAFWAGQPGVSESGSFPMGITWNGTNFYVVDNGLNSILQITSAGVVSHIAGQANQNGSFAGDGGPAINGEFNDPVAVAATPAGDLLIADSSNNRIRAITLGDGMLWTVAGNGTAGAYGEGDDGIATMAPLNYPTGVAADDAGNYFIAESGNYAIRMVDTNMIISTIAGDGTPGDTGDGGAPLDAQLAETENFGLGIVCDSASGKLFVISEGTHRIRKIRCMECPELSLDFISVAGDATHEGDGFDQVSADSSIVDPQILAGSANYEIDLTGFTAAHGPILNYLGQLTGGGAGSPGNPSGYVSCNVKITFTHDGGSIVLVDEFHEEEPAESETFFGLEFPGSLSLIPYVGQVVEILCEYDAEANAGAINDATALAATVLTVECC